MNDDQKMQAAVAHFRAGRFTDAAALCRQVIAADPKRHQALGLLGIIDYNQGRHAAAADLITRAIALHPASADYQNSLGLCLAAQGIKTKAIAAFRKAVALSPRMAEAHANLATALRDAGQLDESILVCRTAISLRPDLAVAHNTLGAALKDKNQLDESIAAYRQAIALSPNFAEAHQNLAVALTRMCLYDDAIAAGRRAIAIAPRFAEAHVSLGVALVNKGQIHDAIATFQKALSIQPDSRGAHFSLGLSRLLLGDFLAGWPDYEWRVLDPDRISPHVGFAQPRWDGSDLAGRRILLHAEQGYGDTIQFARYVSLVAARNATVILEVPPALLRLFKSFPGAAHVLAAGQPLPSFDIHCPLMSLPGLFATTVQSIPAQNSYLSADPQLQQKWRDRLSTAGGVGNYKVGLAWSGSPGNSRNHIRSIPPSALAPLAQIPGVRLINLQKPDRARDQTLPPPDLNLLDMTADLKDFAETAALIANLDLVITVDTAVAHLAGALGKPVWVLLAHVPDWRWLLDRNDCPWYPSARLFRQPAVGDWATPVRQVADALRELAAPRP